MDTLVETQTPRELFIQSLDRCTRRSSFIPAFYERFISSSPVVREKFKDTSFDRQYGMLLRSLRISADATNGRPEALIEISDRAISHNREHLDIQPELYELWLDNLILTAEEFDEQWNEKIEHAWRTILGFVVKRMTAAYNQTSA